MAKCENCYHYHICDLQYRLEDYQECKYYKDKSLIVELPCKEILAKIGDSMYFITDETDEVIETMVSVIEIDCDGEEWIETVAVDYDYEIDDEICSYIYFRFSEFGKTLFLSREEAEKALEEREEREKNGKI